MPIHSDSHGAALYPGIMSGSRSVHSASPNPPCQLTPWCQHCWPKNEPAYLLLICLPLLVINRKGFGSDRMSTSLPQSRDRLSPQQTGAIQVSNAKTTRHRDRILPDET